MMQDRAVKLIALVHIFAALLHLAFWILAAQRLPSPGGLMAGAERTTAATTWGFGVADLVWSAPLLLVAGVGLLKGRDWGWLSAQLSHVLYGYSLTVVVVRDVLSDAISPGTVLFGPFALFSVWAAVALWTRRERFFASSSGRRRGEP